MKKDNSEEKILSAAKKVFLARGMSGARMQDIADEAGINKALLHYYFRNKEKLFDMIYRDAFSRLFPKISSIVESDIPLPEKIRAFCETYIDMLSKNDYLPLFVLNEANTQPQRFRQKFLKHREMPLLKLVQEIETEIREKRIRTIKPAQLIMNMISMCIFPFIAKPIWMMATGMSEPQFRQFIEERKKAIPEFIMESIKK